MNNVPKNEAGIVKRESGDSHSSWKRIKGILDRVRER